jgi:hypothetical protein
MGHLRELAVAKVASSEQDPGATTPELLKGL